MRTKSTNRLTVISIIFILLVTIFIAKDGFNFLSYSSAPAIANLEQSKVSQLLIQDGQQTTELIQQDNQWLVKNNALLQKADQERISSLLSSVVSLKKEEVISKTKAKQSEFGIGKQKITVTTPGRTFTVYVGNNANLSRNYVRLNDEDEIFVAVGFDTVFTPMDYRDLSVGLISDETMVDTIAVNHDNTSFKIELTANDWFLNSKKVPQERVSFFLNDLKTLKASDVMKNDMTLTDPALTIQVTEKGQNKKAELFDQGDNYYLKVSGSDNIFNVKSAYVESLKKTERDFLN